MAYIDKERAIGLLLYFKKNHSNLPKACLHMIDISITVIKNMTTADVVEVKHGCWKDIYVKNGYGDIIEKQIECSECKDFFKIESHDNSYWKKRFNICPFCGAVMDGKE